jgi:hypothetical protein
MRTLAGFQLPSIDELATWVAGWLEPLSRTGLGFMTWEAQSRSKGAYIAILLVLALLVWRAVMLLRRKVAVFVTAFGVLLVLLLANIVLSILNDHLTEQQQILLWRDSVWKWAYAALSAWIPCFVATASFLLGVSGGPPPTTGGGTPTTTT